MKRFQFRLERVLDYRNAVKKDKERELVQQQGILHEATGRADEIRSAHDNSPVIEEGLTTMAEIALGGHYQLRLRELLAEQEQLVAEAVAAVECARDAYLEKAIEAEVLESFRERRLQTFREEERRQARKDLDKFVVSRSARRSKKIGVP